jgi:hypothetical protein
MVECRVIATTTKELNKSLIQQKGTIKIGAGSLIRIIKAPGEFVETSTRAGFSQMMQLPETSFLAAEIYNGFDTFNRFLVDSDEFDIA